jgi:hypothetical protein
VSPLEVGQLTPEFTAALVRAGSALLKLEAEERVEHTKALVRSR